MKMNEIEMRASEYMSEAKYMTEINSGNKCFYNGLKEEAKDTSSKGHSR